ncbi:RcnB family protein [Phenylobacterium sp.]|jgi:Ni/Co efflux regulator RcnB|uniref:RcnB family protein n=1 Tax=Phenylobacterium sp. TaxID=1871053 RepID=UPI002F91D6AF
MKTTIAALTLLLLAGAGTQALAQDKDQAELRAQAEGDPEPRGRVGGGGPRGSAPPTPREFRPAPRPPEAPQALSPREPSSPPDASGGERRRRVEGGGERRGGEGRPRRPFVDTEGDNVNPGLSGADRQDFEDREELRQGGRWIGRGVQARPPGERPVADGQPGRDGRRDGDRGRGGRPDGDGRRGDGDRDGRRDGDRDGRRWDGDRDGRRDGDRDGRRWDGDRDGRRDGDRDGRRWDGDRDGRRDGARDGRRWDGERRGPPTNHPRWDGRRYPHSYNSRHRYRGHLWRPPSGFYVRLWSFGDVLPRGWYEPDYRIIDWWVYDLPIPPPGYDWVRVGYDALLIDRFTGRVVQVVRFVFW